MYTIKKFTKKINDYVKNFIRKMKEDQNTYENLLRETHEKIQRIEKRYDFGLEVNKIKMEIFDKKEKGILPKLNFSLLNHSNKINESKSYRTENEKITENQKFLLKISQNNSILSLRRENKSLHSIRSMKKLIKSKYFFYF